jgi:hypothetical protein
LTPSRIAKAARKAAQAAQVVRRTAEGRRWAAVFGVVVVVKVVIVVPQV